MRHKHQTDHLEESDRSWDKADSWTWEMIHLPVYLLLAWRVGQTSWQKYDILKYVDEAQKDLAPGNRAGQEENQKVDGMKNVLQNWKPIPTRQKPAQAGCEEAFQMKENYWLYGRNVWMARVAFTKGAGLVENMACIAGFSLTNSHYKSQKYSQSSSDEYL